MGNHDSWSKLAGLYHLPKDKPYYSFDKGNVHFLSISTESDLRQNSAQYKFINTDLDIASQNRSIEWIIVLAHRPFISSETENISEKENLQHILPCLQNMVSMWLFRHTFIIIRERFQFSWIISQIL